MEDRIETLYGNDEITNRTLQVFENTQKSIEGCIGKEGIRMHVVHEWHMNGLLKLKQRGVHVRVVTEVTHDNLPFCKTYSEVVELRHLDGIMSSFGISDGKWLLDHIVSLDEFPLSHAILTNVTKLVEAKRKLFETVWKQSIPALEMFTKLERFNPPEINAQLDSGEAKKKMFNLITNSKYHVDMIIPSGNCFQSLIDEGLKDCLNSALDQGVKVRVLLPKEKHTFEPENEFINSNFELKQVEDIRAKRIVLITDNRYSLTIETNEVQKDGLNSSLRNGIYSTSSVGIMTSTALFEKMWTSPT